MNIPEDLKAQREGLLAFRFRGGVPARILEARPVHEQGFPVCEVVRD